MSYDDMPIGTVLLKPDSGAVFVRVDTAPEWAIACRDGRTGLVETRHLLPGLVELVEAPAAPKLRDGDNELWLPVGDLYCRESDTLGRAEVERNVGALAEEMD